MKKAVLIFLLIFGHIVSYSQYYDLIITNNGVAIACLIVEVTDDAITYKWMTQKNWVQSSMKKDRIAVYKWKAINKSTVIFETGSTVINQESQRGKDFVKYAIEGDSIKFQPDSSAIHPKRLVKDPESIYDIPKNSIYVDLGIYFRRNDYGYAYKPVLFSINYDRVIPVHNKIGVNLRGGVGTISVGGALGIAEVSILAGGPRHCAEAGVGIFAGGFVTEVYYRVGYRMVPRMGFTTKFAILLNSGDIGLSLSLGYAF